MESHLLRDACRQFDKLFGERDVEANDSLHFHAKFKGCLLTHDAVCTVVAFSFVKKLQHVICENTGLWCFTIILPTRCCLLASRTLLLLVGVAFSALVWAYVIFLEFLIQTRGSSGFTFGGGGTIF